MIIIGTGGFAKEVKTYSGRTATMVLSEDFLKVYFQNKSEGVVIAIGDGSVRRKIVAEFPKTNWTVVNHSKSWGDNIIAEGSIICPGTIITQHVGIGKHVVINLNCTIGHDTIIGDFTTVSPGANISGNVYIGENCYIGSNAVIREKINICDDVTIGAGAVVVKDITEPGTYVGNPCKKIG